MSESQQLNEAHKLISENKRDAAAPILWKLYSSNTSAIKLDAILALLVVLDHVTETPKLLEITDVGIDIAMQLHKDDVRGYLLGQKSVFLLTQLGYLIYRQKNLKLAAGVFKWIDFSLGRDKKEFEAIAQKRIEMERELRDLENTIMRLAETSTSHYFRGRIFATIGDCYSSKYFNDHLDFMKGGRIRSKIATIYLVRRWNIDKLLYDREIRRRIHDSRTKCIQYFEKAIAEFEADNLGSETAHTVYNLAVRLQSMNLFSRANKLLVKARNLANTHGERMLLGQIEKLELELRNKNRKIRDYVEEYGLDMP